MYKFIRYVLILLSVWLGILGLFTKNYNVILCAITGLYIHNIVYSLEAMRTRIYFFMMHIMIFVFLLSRPVITMLRGEIWWQKYGEEHVAFALLVLSLSLLFLFLGAVVQGAKKNDSKENKTTLKEQHTLVYQKNLKIISLILFYFSAIFAVCLELEKLFFMHGKTYLEYYTSFQSQLPYVVYMLSTFAPYCLCAFLAMQPSKRECIIPLGIYWCLAIPQLIIGIRNPIMLRSIFILLYFFMRETLEKNKKWIGKIEKGALLVGIPFVLCFMVAYSNIRVGESIVEKSIGETLVDFFYSQGVSFDVLAIGHATIPQLPEREFRNYTFGGIIDYFRYGSIGQKLWGTVPIENGNNIRNAMESNSFAHNMSYISKGQKYLDGEGWGSSYLLETYVDYGYLGVVVFSFILGMFLIYGTTLWKKRGIKLIIYLVILTQIFFMPRSAATESINFLLTMQFWVSVLTCYIVAGLCCKVYEKGEFL